MINTLDDLLTILFVKLSGDTSPEGINAVQEEIASIQKAIKSSKAKPKMGKSYLAQYR
jgi:hypothetical protein